MRRKAWRDDPRVIGEGRERSCDRMGRRRGRVVVSMLYVRWDVA